MSFSHHNPSFMGSKTAREVINMVPQSSRRSNKSTSRQDSLSRKPSTSAGRRTNSKDKSTSFTNSSFLNNSQIDNQRSSSQNAHYPQESSLSNYIAQAFDRERRSTTTNLSTNLSTNLQFQGSTLLQSQLNLQRKENKSPLTSRPASRFEEQQKTKTLQEVSLNKTKSSEEFRQREFQYLMRIAGLEKEMGRMKNMIEKGQHVQQRSIMFEQQDLMEKSVQRLQTEKQQLEGQMTQLKDSLLALKDNLNAQLAENALLKKYVSTHTSKRSDSKISTRTNTITSVGSLSGFKLLNRQATTEVNAGFRPSIIIALSMSAVQQS